MSKVTDHVYKDCTYFTPEGKVTRHELTGVTVDGVKYYRTGRNYDRPVFMQAWKWPTLPFTDNGLYVFDEQDGEMIPLADLKNPPEKVVAATYNEGMAEQADKLGFARDCVGRAYGMWILGTSAWSMNGIEGEFPDTAEGFCQFVVAYTEHHLNCGRKGGGTFSGHRQARDSAQAQSKEAGQPLPSESP